MSRVLPFSRVYPSYHPKAGQPTNFVEKFWVSLGKEFVSKQAIAIAASLTDLRKDSIGVFGAIKDIHYERIMGFPPKHHTMRAGHRWKAGMMFSPRVWGDDVNPTSGRKGAYHSKQIIIAPDIEVKKTFDFTITQSPPAICINGFPIGSKGLIEIATNDGLTVDDLLAWFKFPKPFYGQIICWSDSVDYLSPTQSCTGAIEKKIIQEN